MLITRRRPTDSFPLYWEFPGGTCEPGESLEQCVIREMQEELGVTVTVESRGPEVVHQYPDRTVRLIGLWCRLVDGQPRPLEALDCRWVTAAELAQYRFPPASTVLIDAVAQRLAQSHAPP